jgi:ATP-dependent helicase YprA (DUF1998 family)
VRRERDPAQRREIERRLVDGELLGVSATDALELGIDIGLLDAVVSVGFPGTVASPRPDRRLHAVRARAASIPLGTRAHLQAGSGIRVRRPVRDTNTRR